jgi:hypothetical protein
MGIGMEKTALTVEDGDGRAQGIQRAEQRCGVFPIFFPAVDRYRTGHGHFFSLYA